MVLRSSRHLRRRGVQFLLGHNKIDSKVRNLGVEREDLLATAEAEET